MKEKDNLMDIEEDNSEEEFKTLFEMKGKGFKRANPHTESVPKASSMKRDLKCKVCDYTGSSEYQLRIHNDSHHVQHPPKVNKIKEKEEEFNCVQCDYQGYKDVHLKKHISLKHMEKEKPHQGTIKCRMCAESFRDKWDLMLHRKANHIGAVAPCRKYLNNECGYTDASCWWKHTEIESFTDNLQCFTCNKFFQTKQEMMNHKKNHHGDKVQTCSRYLQGICIFQSKFCWYDHRVSDKEQSGGSDEAKK